MLSKARPEEATAVFNQLVKDYPDTQYARLGAMERAMLAYNNGRTEEAIKAYKDLIARYPESEEARSALSDLKNIYVSLDRVDEYTAYASTLGKQLTPSESEKAHLQYLSLESRYKKDKNASIADLESFVRSYPASREAGRAELLLWLVTTPSRAAATKLRRSTRSSLLPHAPSTCVSPPSKL